VYTKEVLDIGSAMDTVALLHLNTYKLLSITSTNRDVFVTLPHISMCMLSLVVQHVSQKETIELE